MSDCPYMYVDHRFFDGSSVPVIRENHWFFIMIFKAVSIESRSSFSSSHRIVIVVVDIVAIVLFSPSYFSSSSSYSASYYSSSSSTFLRLFS